MIKYFETTGYSSSIVAFKQVCDAVTNAGTVQCHNQCTQPALVTPSVWECTSAVTIPNPFPNAVPE